MREIFFSACFACVIRQGTLDAFPLLFFHTLESSKSKQRTFLPFQRNLRLYKRMCLHFLVYVTTTENDVSMIENRQNYLANVNWEILTNMNLRSN